MNQQQEDPRTPYPVPRTPLAIYLHFPFCRSKCPYCDFNSQPIGQIDHAAWAVAYAREIDCYARLLPERLITSVYFGGGTPSLMPSSTVAAVLEKISNNWPLADDIEITLEANPSSSEAEKFAAFRKEGVNRLSLGVQSFSDDALLFLGRAHNADEARRAIELAAEIFPRFTFDLIYARAGQSPADWEKELNEAFTFHPKHLSLYQLTIEPGTPFEKRARTNALTASEDDAATMYEMTQAICENANLPQYEISNYAAPGEESRHNLTYWRYDDYIGLGPGAHGRYVSYSSPPRGGEEAKSWRYASNTLDFAGEGESRQHDTINNIERHATENARTPEDWYQSITENGHSQSSNEILSTEEAQREALMMGLRLTQGINLAVWQHKFGISLLDYLPVSRLQLLIRQGLCLKERERLMLSSAGRQRLDAILRLLVLS